MTLVHFTESPFYFDSTLKYNANGYLRYRKPRGIWLSHETKNGWKDWCIKNEWALERLKYRTFFEIKSEGLLILDSLHLLREFENKFLIPEAGLIDWKTVQQNYSGVAITDVFEKHPVEMQWLSCWDCDSVCVWELSILRIHSNHKSMR